MALYYRKQLFRHIYREPSDFLCRIILQTTILQDTNGDMRGIYYLGTLASEQCLSVSLYYITYRQPQPYYPYPLITQQTRQLSNLAIVCLDLDLDIKQRKGVINSQCTAIQPLNFISKRYKILYVRILVITTGKFSSK